MNKKSVIKIITFLAAVIFVFNACSGKRENGRTSPVQHKNAVTNNGITFFAGYIEHINTGNLANRDRIEFGDGAETIIIYSDKDLHDFKIFDAGANFLEGGDIYFTRDRLLNTEYLVYSTNIPKGDPAEGIYFYIYDGAGDYVYLLSYSEAGGTVVAIEDHISRYSTFSSPPTEKHFSADEEVKFFIDYALSGYLNMFKDGKFLYAGNDGEELIIYCNVDMYEFIIYSVDYYNDKLILESEIFNRNVFPSDYALIYRTNVSEGIPNEAFFFRTADGTIYSYIIQYSGISGSIVVSEYSFL